MGGILAWRMDCSEQVARVSFEELLTTRALTTSPLGLTTNSMRTVPTVSKSERCATKSYHKDPPASSTALSNLPYALPKAETEERPRFPTFPCMRVIIFCG